jgi:hypothetical protein
MTGRCRLLRRPLNGTRGRIATRSSPPSAPGAMRCFVCRMWSRSSGAQALILRLQRRTGRGGQRTAVPSGPRASAPSAVLILRPPAPLLSWCASHGTAREAPSTPPARRGTCPRRRYGGWRGADGARPRACAAPRAAGGEGANDRGKGKGKRGSEVLGSERGQRTPRVSVGLREVHRRHWALGAPETHHSARKGLLASRRMLEEPHVRVARVQPAVRVQPSLRWGLCHRDATQSEVTTVLARREADHAPVIGWSVCYTSIVQEKNDVRVMRWDSEHSSP